MQGMTHSELVAYITLSSSAYNGADNACGFKAAEWRTERVAGMRWLLLVWRKAGWR